MIDNELRDFRLGGAELADDDKARFKRSSEELAQTGCAIRGESARHDERMVATDSKRVSARGRSPMIAVKWP
jgi:Zn-dependent oligopeptidase